MAKRVNKTQELRAKVKRQIRSLEKRGYEVPEELKQNIETANYSRLHSYHKDKYKRLYSESRYVDIETGEITSGYKALLRRRWKPKTPKSKLVDFSDLAGTFDPETGEIFDHETDFYNRTGYNHGGQMTMGESTDVILGNVVDDFIEQLSQEIPEYYYTSNGKKKHVNPWAKRSMEDAQQSLLNLAYSEIFSGKKEELAWRLQEHSEEISELIRKLYSDSDSGQINAARARLAYIIAGRNLSVKELMDLEAEEITYNGYEEI